MKTTSTAPFLSHQRSSLLTWIVFLGLTLFILLPLAAGAQDSVSDKVSHVADQTGQAIRGASQATEQAAQKLWARIDAARLKNRTPDQIMAWVIMGVLVGAIAGMATGLRSTGMGRLGRLLLGLAGAFIGGLIVSVANVDFGWGVVILRYEELVFAFGGAILLLALSRVIRRCSAKKSTSK